MICFLSIFCVYMEGVNGEVNARMLDREVILMDDEREWNVHQLLVADDTAPVANSEER